MSLEQTQQETLIGLIQEALSQDQLRELLPRQQELMDLGLNNLLKNHSVEELTVEMVQGQYEQVTEQVAPAERILLSEKLSA